MEFQHYLYQPQFADATAWHKQEWMIPASQFHT